MSSWIKIFYIPQSTFQHEVIHGVVVLWDKYTGRGGVQFQFLNIKVVGHYYLHWMTMVTFQCLMGGEGNYLPLTHMSVQFGQKPTLKYTLNTFLSEFEEKEEEKINFFWGTYINQRLNPKYLVKGHGLHFLNWCRTDQSVHWFDC